MFRLPPIADFEACDMAFSQYTKNEPKRINLIRLFSVFLKLAKAGDQEAYAALLGWSIIGFEEIKTEYSGRASYLFNIKNSEIHNAFKKHIFSKAGKPNEDPVKDSDRLYYIGKLISYFENHFAAVDILPNGEKKTGVLDRIIKMGVQIAKRDANPKGDGLLKQLLHTTPALPVLQQHMQHLQLAYHQEHKPTFAIFNNEANRESLLAFYNFMENTFDIYPKETATLPAIMAERLKLDEWNARVGLILLVAMDVNVNKYLPANGSWFNQGSALFKESLKLIGKDSIDEIPEEDIHAWFHALAAHVYFLKEQLTKNDTRATELQQQFAVWNKNGLSVDDRLNQLLQKIRTFDASLVEERQNKRAGSWIATTALDKGLKWGTAGVVGYAIATNPVPVVNTAVKLTTMAIPHVARLGGVVVAASPLGVAGYATTAVAATFVSHFIATRAVTKLTTSLTNWVFDTTTDFVATKAKEAILKPFSEKGAHPSADKYDPRWVNVLLGMPSSIISDEFKETIRRVYGLEKDQFLPLSKEEPVPLTMLNAMTVEIEEEYQPAVKFKA